MNDRSTVRTTKFVVISIVLFLTSKLIYDKFVFGCLPDMAYKTSRIFLWIMLLVSIAVVFGCIFRMQRTYRGIIASLLIPYGIYTICVYWRTLHINITFVLLIAAALSLFIGNLILIRRIAATVRKEQVTGHKFRSWFAATGTIFTAAMAVIIAPLLFQAVSVFTVEEAYGCYSRIREHLDGEMEKAEESGRDSSLEGYTVCSEKEGMYLTDKKGNKVAGPYRRIFTHDLKGYDHICRYQDENGLMGYLAADGTVLTPAIYIEASRFTDGKARVRESGGMYYINNSFERISDNYMDGLDFESQGTYARVLLNNGKWGIINSHGKLVLNRADYIHPLPILTQASSAVIQGHACLFFIFFDNDDVIIIKKFEDFCAISEVFNDSFAIVENEEGMKAVVDVWGRIIVPPQYKSIEFLDVSSHPFFGDRDIIFTCTKENGSVHTIRKRW